MPQGTGLVRDNQLMVVKLTDHNAKTWKLDTLYELFSSEDVEHILKIPLSRKSMEDRVIWSRDFLGQFSSKSAYIVARELLGREDIYVEPRSV